MCSVNYSYHRYTMITNKWFSDSLFFQDIEEDASKQFFTQVRKIDIGALNQSCTNKVYPNKRNDCFLFIV